ncbi:MAG TPA: DUF3810 domain-containing protein [Clostridium sp.]|jgi:hypothetical protein|nr:DUF3810 domain-containing protein [Clostridium sp.]
MLGVEIMKMKKKAVGKLVVIGMVPLIMIINLISKSFPDFIERYYSAGVNRPVRQFLSLITGMFLFSLAEILLPGLVIILIYLVAKVIVNIKKTSFLSRLLNLGVYLSALYILFMVLWGFNYNRLSFEEISDLKVEESSNEELYKLCENLIERAKILREDVKEDFKGVMTIEGGYKEVFSKASQGYLNLSADYPELAGKYGKPKKILLSKPMCYTGITGIYIPYTGEANVNVNIRDFMLPATATHEMAHQRGFAREDEANYIAYLACSANEDPQFKYSGVMLALIYSMNALADVDYEGYKELIASYSPGMKRDLIDNMEFWSQYEGKVEEIANNINNSYLKSNGQKDGVQSYGRMVDLLLAEYREQEEK